MRRLVITALLLLMAAPAAAQSTPSDAQVQVMDVARRQYEVTVGQILSSQLNEIMRLKAEVETLKKAAAEKDKKPADKPAEPTPTSPPTP